MANVEYLRRMEKDMLNTDMITNLGQSLKKFWFKKDVDKPQYIYGWNICLY